MAHMLSIAISAAVPLRIFSIYERGGITEAELKQAQEFGKILAEKGDRLLFKSPIPGETASLFNQLAETIAILAFLPGGVKFGNETFQASSLLAGFIGQEKAEEFCKQVWKKEE